MKGRYLSLILGALTIYGCNDCRDNDCGGDDAILISIISDNKLDYSDSIDFYYFDENQQKIEAAIEPNRPGSQIYSAFLNYREPETPGRYYLEVDGQAKTIDIQTSYDKDPCCDDNLRFEQITVDGTITMLPIKIVIN